MRALEYLLVIFMMLCQVLCMNLTSNAQFENINRKYINESSVNSPVNKNNDLIETSCHVKTEELVAIAKVSVSSALENLCNYSTVIDNINEMEHHIRNDINILKNLLFVITNKIINLEQKNKI